MKKVKFLLLAGILGLCSQAAFGRGGEKQRASLEPDVSSMSAGVAAYKFQLIDADTNQLIGDNEHISLRQPVSTVSGFNL